MFKRKKKISLKQQIIDIGIKQLRLHGYLDYEMNEFKITIRYNENKGSVEIKVTNIPTNKWNTETLFLSLTKYTFYQFHILMIRCVDNLVERIRSD